MTTATTTRHRAKVTLRRDGHIEVDGHIVGVWDKYADDPGPGSIGHYYGAALGSNEWIEDRHQRNFRERIVTRFSGPDAGTAAVADDFDHHQTKTLAEADREIGRKVRRIMYRAKTAANAANGLANCRSYVPEQRPFMVGPAQAKFDDAFAALVAAVADYPELEKAILDRHGVGPMR